MELISDIHETPIPKKMVAPCSLTVKSGKLAIRKKPKKAKSF